MKEVCFVLCGEAIVRISLGSATSIPDSQARWNTIWEHREELTEIVHTHPGGLLRFSQEDLTTMEAVEAALGKKLRWSIVTEDGFLSRFGEEDAQRDDEPWWLPVLREISFLNGPGRRLGGNHNKKGRDHVCTD